MSGALLTIVFALVISQAAAGSFTWRQIQSINRSEELPPARKFHAMGYIAEIQLVVIFGGRAANGTLLNDTWVYSFIGDFWMQSATLLSDCLQSLDWIGGLIH